MGVAGNMKGRDKKYAHSVSQKARKEDTNWEADIKTYLK